MDQQINTKQGIAVNSLVNKVNELKQKLGTSSGELSDLQKIVVEIDNILAGEDYKKGVQDGGKRRSQQRRQSKDRRHSKDRKRSSQKQKRRDSPKHK